LRKEHRYCRILNFLVNALSNVCLNSIVQTHNPHAQNFSYPYPLSPPSNIAHRDSIDSGLLLLFVYHCVLSMVYRASMDAQRPRRRSPAIVACRGGCRESLNKGMFSRSSSYFCSAWPKISSSFLHFHRLMAQLFLFLPLLLFFLLSVASRFLPGFSYFSFCFD